MDIYAACEFCHEKAKFVIKLEEFSPDMDRCTRVDDAIILCSDCAENTRFKIEEHDYGFDFNYEIKAEKRVDNENI